MKEAHCTGYIECLLHWAILFGTKIGAEYRWEGITTGWWWLQIMLPKPIVKLDYHPDSEEDTAMAKSLLPSG